ncbi:MAG: fatty acid desaturase [Bryobacteraceae bacterium]
MPNYNLTPGRQALAIRDQLETVLVRRLPHLLQPSASRMLTAITGLAPTGATAPAEATEPRAFALMMAAILAGLAGLFLPVPLAIAAGLLLVHGMRQFSSVVGHHMTHGAKVMPGPAWLRRVIYDVASAMLLLPRFEAYRRDHQRHHAYAAGPRDTDQRFIAWLGARFDGVVPFGLTIVEPRFHARFLWARLRANLAEGPLARRALALAFNAAMLWSASLAWVMFAGVLYQIATLVQWASEHLWGTRPEGQAPMETSIAVTYGRLLLPDPGDHSLPGLLAHLAVYAAFRFLLVTGDLVNHDLHHLAIGPWTHHPYVRNRLILEGRIPLRQTVSLQGTFRVAFDSARGTADPQPPRNMDGGQMLGM